MILVDACKEALPLGPEPWQETIKSLHMPHVAYRDPYRAYKGRIYIYRLCIAYMHPEEQAMGSRARSARGASLWRPGDCAVVEHPDSPT